jgi:hypothetical protein
MSRITKGSLLTSGLHLGLTKRPSGMPSSGLGCTGVCDEAIGAQAACRQRYQPVVAAGPA